MSVGDESKIDDVNMYRQSMKHFQQKQQSKELFMKDSSNYFDDAEVESNQNNRRQSSDISF